MPGIMRNFPTIWCVFGVRTTSGVQDYEIFPEIGYDLESGPLRVPGFVRFP